MTNIENDKDTFEAMLFRSGLSVTESQKADLFVGYGHIVRMAGRLRGEQRRPREAEPASIFKADS